MYKHSKLLFSAILMVFAGTMMTATAQQPPQYVAPQGVYPSTSGQYYYNQNNPYSNSTNNQPNGFYGGFYGSPPPPTPAQAFPDKAASDSLYRYIQSR